MTREEAAEVLQSTMMANTKNREPAVSMAIRSLKAWDEVIGNLEYARGELLKSEDKSTQAFAKGITFAVSMMKNHLKDVEE